MYINDGLLPDQPLEVKVYTIDSIAEASGFNSRSTFYRVFQNVFGMSPSQYLEIQKEQSEIGNEIAKDEN